jgi:excisionase family DNA binding protein
MQLTRSTSRGGTRHDAADAPCTGVASGERRKTIGEVALFMNVSRDMVENLIRNGKLVAVDVSPRAGQLRHRPMWRLRASDVEAFLQKRVTQVRPPETRARRPSSNVIEFVK